MAEISKIRRCYNCGAILQSSDPKKEGYTKKETLENPSQNFLFCDKCFELERYKARPNEPILSDDYIKLLKDAKAKKALIVYVVNLFSFEAAFNHQILENIEGMNILIVANKFDLMPKGTSKEEIKEYVAHRFRAAGLTQIKAEDVSISNAYDEKISTEVITSIYERKAGHDVFIIGSAMSGKKTLISSFLKVFSNLSQGNIVTAPYPGTELELLQIPLNKKTAMYDVPGFSLDNSILYNLDRDTMRKVYTLDPVKERHITLSKKECLYIGGLAFIELVKGKSTQFNCYFCDKIQLKHILIPGKSADEKFVKLVNKKSLQPSLPAIQTIKDLDVFELNVTESNYRDIGILGLGWINFMACKQTIRIYVPKGVSIYHSRPKLLRKK